MSDRLTPISWKHKEKIYKKFGYVFFQQEGSHRTYVKKDFQGLPKEEIRKLPMIMGSAQRPPIIVLTAKKEIPVGILQHNKRKLRLTTKEFRQAIKETG